MTERRKHIRLPLLLTAEFKMVVGAVYKGQTKNIGFGGMYVEFPEDEMPLVRLEDRCTLTLILYQRKRRLALEFNCLVIHKRKNGVGLKIHNFDFAYIGHLKSLLAPGQGNSAQCVKGANRQPTWLYGKKKGADSDHLQAGAGGRAPTGRHSFPDLCRPSNQSVLPSHRHS